MSAKEFSRRKLISMVFQRAWKYFRSRGINGYSFSLCLKLAWKTVRGFQRLIYSKVRGVSYCNENVISRQKILANLRKYSLTDVGLEFVRDYENPYDKNAISILASVKDKGSAVVGYLSAELARDIAPLLDSGVSHVAFFLGVTGQDTLGLNFAFSLIQEQTAAYPDKKEKSPLMALQSLSE